jgi:hypothetical protein
MVSSQIQPMNICRSMGFVKKISCLLLTTCYRSQAFRINLSCFSCLKSGFPWLPSLDLPLTTFLQWNLFHIPLSVPKTRFFVTSVLLAFCVSDCDGFRLALYREPVSWDRSVSPHVERNQPYSYENSLTLPLSNRRRNKSDASCKW